MLKYITLLLSFFCSFAVIAQQSVQDSLFQDAIIMKDDTLKVKKLNTAAFKYYSLNPDSTILIANMSFALAEKLEYKPGMAQALKYQGVGLYIKSDFNTALEKYKAALVLFEELKDLKNMSSVYNNSGLIFFKLKDFNQAIVYYKRVIEISDKINATKTKASVLLNLGAIYDNIDSTQMAIDSYNESYRIRSKSGDLDGMARCATNIGYIYLRKKEYKKALEYMLPASETIEQSGDYYTLSTIYINIGDIYLDLGKLSKSKDYYDKGYEAAVKSGSIDLEMDANYRYYKYFNATENFKKALSYHKEYLFLSDSIYSLEFADRIADIETKYESEKKEKENELLREKAQKDASEIKMQQFLNWLIFAVLVTVLAVAFFILRLSIIRRKANEVLLEKNFLINQQKEEIITQIKGYKPKTKKKKQK